MSWVAVAIGGGTALTKGIQANQSKQRQKGYIEDSYRRASQGLDIAQRGARESGAESLNARGLAQDGSVTASPIHTAMIGGLMKSLSNPNTIGGQVQSDAGVQMGLERQDLDTQHTRAQRENKVEYENALLGAGVSGVETGIGVHGAIADWQASKKIPTPGGGGGGSGGPPMLPPPTPTLVPPSSNPVGDISFTPQRSSIHAALLSAASYDGIHPNDPLGEPTSKTYTGYRPPKLAEPGQSNASFTAG